MALGKWQRKILKGVVIALAALLVLIAALPAWFPWVLRPALKKAGLQYATYERLGYSRFTLRGVSYTDPNVKVHVEKVEAWIPPVWLWRWNTSATNALPFAQVSGWQVQVLENDDGGGEGSVYKSFHDVADVVAIVKKWVPTAVISNGIFYDRKLNVNVPTARWSQETLTAQANLSNSLGGFVVTAGFNSLTSGVVRIESNPLKFQFTGQVSADASGLNIQSLSLWQSNRIEIEVGFGRKRTLPEKANLRAPNLVVPPELAGLPGYQPISGSLAANWTNGEFVMDVQAEGRPQTAETNLPPATLRLHVRGNTNSAVVESAKISAPWLNAQLSRGLELHYTGQLLREPAALKFAADLTTQPWVALGGVVQGEAALTPGSGKIPNARFHAAGTKIGYAELEARTFEANGNLEWPLLKISSAHAEFDDGSTAAIGGVMDLETNTLSQGEFSFNGVRSGVGGDRTPLSFLRHLLPDDYSYETLSVTGTFAGPLTSPGQTDAHTTWTVTNIAHSGRLEVAGLSGPDVRPLHIAGTWEARGVEFRAADVTVVTTNSALRASASLQIGGSGVAGNLTRLSLTNHGEPAMVLAEPTKFLIRKMPSETNRWDAEIESFDWQGKAGKIQAQTTLDWPRAGDIRCAAERINSDLFQDFLNTRMQEGQIQSFTAYANWNNGPVKFGIDLSGVVVPPRELISGTSATISPPRSARDKVPPNENPRDDSAARSAPLSSPIDFELKLHGDPSGVTVSNLVVNSQTSAVAVAHGFLPLTITPGQRTNLWHIDLDRPLQIAANTEPNAFFWGKVADWTGINLRDPKVAVDVSGTWKRPLGEVRVTAEQIQMRKAKAPTPTVEKVQVGLLLDREMARLTNCQMLVQGQPLTLSGEMPLGEEFWQGLREKRFPNWEKATARVTIADADISGFAPLLPDVVSPAGKVNLEVSLQSGGNLTGDLKIRGARTRTLPEVGAIRDINCDLRFENRNVKLALATARIGEAPVTISGHADLSGTNWLRGRVPPFEVAVTGTNVPLSRHPESILRSDLNLTIRKANDAPALIAGEARLRNSFYLSDLADLVPGQVASPEQRPPYFSIVEEPLAEWRLAVSVGGQRGLRIRSTLFNGEVSVHLNLAGTLKDPSALGDVRIESGTVRFPFAALRVQQGFVTLSSQDPYHPNLQITATSKEYGYDINMAVNGPADAPVVQFTSVPPLTSEQIVLLVTAGNVPSQTHLSTQQRAQTMAVFLGRDLLTRLGFSDEGESRLSFHSGQEITEEGKPTYNLEYKLNNRWSLVGEYDRFNAFNAGLKWKIYSK